MGQLFSLIAQYLFPNKEYKIVMVGLDNAGKTTTLYRLHLGEAVVTQPTVGSNVECVQYKNLKFEVWDLGGQANLRPSWATYYRLTDAVIVVIDSTDRARASIAKVGPAILMKGRIKHAQLIGLLAEAGQNELFNLLDHEHLSEAAILIMANKQDLKDAMTVKEMSDVLSLHTIKRHDWHIQATCAKTGEGLMEGMEWIAQRMKGETAASTPVASPQPSPAKPLAAEMRA